MRELHVKLFRYFAEISDPKKMKKRNAGKLKIKSEARTRNHTVDKKKLNIERVTTVPQTISVVKQYARSR